MDAEEKYYFHFNKKKLWCMKWRAERKLWHNEERSELKSANHLVVFILLYRNV